MKTDAALKQDLEAELAWDPAVKSESVGISVKDGVATVSGHIETYAQKWAIENALRRVNGVKAIALELDVRLSPDHQRSDTDIARAAEAALRWHTLVPGDAVRIAVDKGWVTLEGEVDWDYQRRSVEHAVHHLTGVVGVSNGITLRAQVTPPDISRRIGDALKRQLEREMKHLDVSVQGDTVTLRGTVHSWHERDAARGAAWAAPGVRHVVNELKIA